MSVLQVVIVGAGQAGKELRADHFNRLPETRVVAFCDPDLERAQQAAEEKGTEGAYTTLEEALERHAPEIVVVCSPPQFHLAQTREALAGGAHVLLEKPMGMSADEIEPFREAAKQAERKLCLIHNQKFDTPIQQAMALVRDGRIGEVLHVSRSWMRAGAEDRMLGDEPHWCQELPGGRLGETLPHDLYLGYQFLGEMEVVALTGGNMLGRWPSLPADEIHALLTNGRASYSLSMSFGLERGIRRHLLVEGTHGSLFADDGGARLLGRRKPSPASQFLTASKSLVRAFARKGKKAVGRGARLAGMARSAKSEPNSGHYRLIKRFVLHVTEDAPSPVSWEEAAATARLAADLGGRIDALANRPGDAVPSPSGTGA